jgi:F-type H+-transporting ATPase subunit delta
MTTAMPATVSKGLIDDLNRIVGSKTEIKQKIDRNLIGGVVLKVDDTLIDGSIKRQLENLKDTLKE